MCGSTVGVPADGYEQLRSVLGAQDPHTAVTVQEAVRQVEGQGCDPQDRVPQDRLQATLAAQADEVRVDLRRLGRGRHHLQVPGPGRDRFVVVVAWFGGQVVVLPGRLEHG